MAKIELTISPQYQRNWGVWHGIRELVANGFDAEVEHNAPCTVSWHNDTLRIENENVTLPREALLIGHTSKADRQDVVGQFGEGLKIGILALLRKDVPIKIRNGSEVWIPSIERSEKFNSEVLVFDIQTGRKDDNRVRIEIGCISKATFETIKERFLRLQTMKEDDMIRTEYGDLLTAERFKGKIFVRGVYIKEKTELNYGYNFTHGTLNRDRDVLDNLDYEMKNIWLAAMVRRPDMLKKFHDLVEESAKDAEGVHQYSAPYMDDSIKDFFADTFKDRYGNDAIPVKSMADSREVEHFGKIGVVVNPAMLAILEQRVDSFEKTKEKLRNEVTKTYGWHDLGPQERENLTWAADLLTQAAETEDLMGTLDVVDFRSESLMGLYKNGRILVARRMLEDDCRTLEVLIHEWCHRFGGDGDKSHVGHIEATWAKCMKLLRNKNQAEA